MTKTIIFAAIAALACATSAQAGDRDSDPAALTRINGEQVGCRRAWQVQGYAWMCMQKPGTPSKPLPQTVSVFTTINKHFVTCRFSSKLQAGKEVLDVWACAVVP
jgi:hypothetical protein